MPTEESYIENDFSKIRNEDIFNENFILEDDCMHPSSPERL